MLAIHASTARPVARAIPRANARNLAASSAHVAGRRTRSSSRVMTHAGRSSNFDPNDPMTWNAPAAGEGDDAVAGLRERLAAAEADAAAAREETASWKKRHGELRAFVSEELVDRETKR